MSIFGSIKDAIFGHPAAAQAAPAPTPAPTPAPAPTQAAPAQPAPAPQPKQVDPEAALEKIAASKGNPDLNWRESIVDLMKLIGMDSSLDNRKQLATELGYTGEKDGSAEMNIWLHKAVMERIRTGK
jgi:3-oxoacyl-ACP reductase-like protein